MSSVVDQYLINAWTMSWLGNIDWYWMNSVESLWLSAKGQMSVHVPQTFSLSVRQLLKNTHNKHQHILNTASASMGDSGVLCCTISLKRLTVFNDVHLGKYVCGLTPLPAPPEVSAQGWSADPEIAWWLVGSWRTYLLLRSPTRRTTEPQRCTSTRRKMGKL